MALASALIFVKNAFIVVKSVDFHRKDEECALAKSQRLNLDAAIVSGHDCIADCQAETSSLLIHVFVLLLKLAESFEKFSNVASIDAQAGVADVDRQHILDWVVCCLYHDKALGRELEGILDQVDQHLLQSDLVAE